MCIATGVFIFFSLQSLDCFTAHHRLAPNKAGTFFANNDRDGLGRDLAGDVEMATR